MSAPVGTHSCPSWFAGPKEELGGGAQRVPVVLGLHRLHPQESTQAEAGRGDEAAGA